MPYFVTVIRQPGARVGVLAGPFDGRTEAEGWVDRAIQAAYDVDPDTHWDSFGVSLIPGRGSHGALNARLGLPVTPGYGVWREGQAEHFHKAAS
jgi:hypothetical protein